LHPFNTWPTGMSGRFDLNTGNPIPPQSRWYDLPDDAADDTVRMVLAGDWGAGTMESAYVAAAMMANYSAHWTVHIGDVYYLGAEQDFASNVFGNPPPGVTNGITWPHGSIGSLAIEGNHEMFSRGWAYFDTFLPTLGVDTGSGMSGQNASYFAMENKYWRVIALDTGYNSYGLFENDNNTQPQPVIDWLVNELNIGDPTDTRGIIVLTHHQPLTAFESKDAYTATANQLQAIFPKRTFLWLWGHEHRVSWYDVNSDVDGIGLTYYGRCVGNSGFPVSLAKIPQRAGQLHLHAYDDRTYEIADGIFKVAMGFLGFSQFNFTGPQLTIDYRSLVFESDGSTLSPDGNALLVTELWTTDAVGNVVLSQFDVVNPNITVVNSF